MTSSLIIMTHWTLNENKTFTFYDAKKIQGFTTGQTKEFKYQDSDKTYKMFEHQIPLSGKLTEAKGFNGYQYTYKKFLVAVAFGRRMKEEKKFVQELDDILVIMGLQEQKVVDVSGNPIVDVSGNNIC
jgi:hypothetical protein